MKKNKVPCHAVTDKPLGEWSTGKFQPSETEDKGK